MCRKHFKQTLAFVLVLLLAVGCASVNYVGKSFDPTTDIDLYFSKEEVNTDYTVIGQAIGSGVWVSNEKIQKKLIDEAKRKGADAILITGLGRAHVPIGDNGSTEENQINASFLKYK